MLELWVFFDAYIAYLMDIIDLLVVSPSTSILIVADMVHWLVHLRGAYCVVTGFTSQVRWYCKIIDRDVVSMSDDKLSLKSLKVLVKLHVLVEILHCDAVPVSMSEYLWLVISDSTTPPKDNFANLPIKGFFFIFTRFEILEVEAFIVSLDVQALRRL